MSAAAALAPAADDSATFAAALTALFELPFPVDALVVSAKTAPLTPFWARLWCSSRLASVQLLEATYSASCDLYLIRRSDSRTIVRVIGGAL